MLTTDAQMSRRRIRGWLTAIGSLVFLMYYYSLFVARIMALFAHSLGNKQTCVRPDDNLRFSRCVFVFNVYTRSSGLRMRDLFVGQPVLH